ncbi:MAG: MBL fold metallo-hydrolase [Moraxella sp.]|nr:MBL fold metallo-hydrolase [Moraxella sp.]
MEHHILYDDGHHKCIAFNMSEEDESVPSNQFMIMDGDEAAIIDPGGDLTFVPLTLEITKFTNMENIKYVIGSHQDPDILASMPRWLLHLNHTKLIIPKLWERFLPHYNSTFTKSRLGQGLSKQLIGVPDRGAICSLGQTHIVIIPAHFLHSVGNIQFFDPVSGILFSGDMGASLIGHSGVAVDNFAEHTKSMVGFHRRYMASNKATRLWANNVRKLPVKMMVPQHGKRLDGRAMFDEFLDWISQLQCGIDLVSDETYDVSKLMAAAKIPLNP